MFDEVSDHGDLASELLDLFLDVAALEADLLRRQACNTERNITFILLTRVFKYPETVEQYSNVNRTIGTKMIKAKEKWISEQCDKIGEGIKEDNNKTTFAALEKLARKQQHKAAVIEDKNGSLLTDDAAVLTRWT